MSKRTLGILTGGGDCPGLNAVIRGVTKTAMGQYGMEVIGFREGFLGLIEKRFEILTPEKVSGILIQGGTILGTSNVANPFGHSVIIDGERQKVDVSDRCMQLYESLGLEALICIGGDGTMTIASKLSELGANIVGVPKTIDKDVVGTDSTFGFDSARYTATRAIDKLHTTADSHQRVMLVEVMGRNSGWLALESGIAGGGDIILIPELPYEIGELSSSIEQRFKSGKRFSIIVVAEGSYPKGGKQTFKRKIKSNPDHVRLGGCSHSIADEIEEHTSIECRVTVLGHLQRGGTPTPLDRILATRFAVKAVDMVVNKEFNRMVALKGIDISSVAIEEVQGKQKKVPLDSPLIRTALSIGTSFGAPIS